MAKQVRLGIVGLGAQGSMYARLITNGMVPNMEIGAICEPNPAMAEVIRSTYPDVACYVDFLTMLNSGDVDAVVICVPPYLHPEMAIAALERGIHALVEKPAGVYTKQVRELNDYAGTKPELSFAMMFNQRSNPLYGRIREIVDGGEIGSIRHTSWIITTWWRPQAYYEQSAWRATWGGEGGGILVNQAPHQLDLWQWICGLPRSVYAKVGYGFRRDIAVEDEVTALVDYGAGVTGVLITAVHDLVGTDRFEILGDNGKIVVENSKIATITRLNKSEREISKEMSLDEVRQVLTGQLDKSAFSASEVIEFNSGGVSQHASVLQNFAANILDGVPLIATGAEGINGVRLANATHLSSWTGREVPLDFDDDLYLSELNQRIREEGRFPEKT